jgi:hypothetical protein
VPQLVFVQTDFSQVVSNAIKAAMNGKPELPLTWVFCYKLWEQNPPEADSILHFIYKSLDNSHLKNLIFQNLLQEELC